MSNSSSCPINMNLSGATTPDQSGPGSNGNEGVLHITKGSMTHHQIVLCHMQDNRCGRWGYSFAEMQSMYSTVPTNRAWFVLSLRGHFSLHWWIGTSHLDFIAFSKIVTRINFNFKEKCKKGKYTRNQRNKKIDWLILTAYQDYFIPRG